MTTHCSRMRKLPTYLGSLAYIQVDSTLVAGILPYPGHRHPTCHSARRSRSPSGVILAVYFQP